MTKSNKDIAMKFAKGFHKGTGNRIFIEDNTVYSYAYNHPIAKRWDKIFLMNSMGYSQTSKRHKMLVFHALKDKWETVIFLPNCDIQKAYEQKEKNEKMIVEFKEKLSRARTKQSYYRSGIKNLIEQNRLIDEMIIPLVIAEKL